MTGVGDGPWGSADRPGHLCGQPHQQQNPAAAQEQWGLWRDCSTLSDVSEAVRIGIRLGIKPTPCSGNNKLLIVDASPAAPTATSKDIAADPYDVKVASGKVYVTSSSSGKLTRRDLDGQNPKVQAGGTGPRGVDYSSTTSRIIVAAFGDNTVKQLDETYD